MKIIIAPISGIDQGPPDRSPSVSPDTDLFRSVEAKR
jgi:hypothetical protein